MAKDRATTFLTACPSYTSWFERFILEMHARMGDDRRSDATLSSGGVLELMKQVELDYIDAEDAGARRSDVVCTSWLDTWDHYGE